MWYKRANNIVARIYEALLQAKMDPGFQVDVTTLEINPFDLESIISEVLGKLPPEPLDEAQNGVIEAIKNQVTSGQALEPEIPLQSV